MKQRLILFFSLLAIATSGSALSFDEARHEALYLTDKMAYELALSTEQMEAVYEINLDYLLNVNRGSDLYGIFWERRNIDLQYVLSTYQYQAYLTANYFYRPLNWIRGNWRLAIYGRYSDPHLFYYSRPRSWVSFRGGRNVGTSSFYMGRNYFAPQKGGKPDRGHTPNSYQRNGQRPGQGYRQQDNNYRPGQGQQGRPGQGYNNSNNSQRPGQGYNNPNNGQRPGQGNYQQGNQGRPGVSGTPGNSGRPTTSGTSGRAGASSTPSSPNKQNSSNPSGGPRVFRK